MSAAGPVLERDRRRRQARQPHTCAWRGCRRVAPMASSPQSTADLHCTLHDGIDHGPVVCECSVARADGIGQCVSCWRPITGLHPGLGAPVVGQVVVRAAP